MQEEFYRDVICTPNSNHRYWMMNDGASLAGLTYIDWINRIAEISLIVDPSRSKKGYGEASVLELIRKGFNELGLNEIYGECYLCNPGLGFWKKMAEKYKWYTTVLPRRKLWKLKYYDSLYFSVKGVPND